MRRSVATAATVLCFLGAATASARPSQAKVSPPGNSGASEYLENLPGAGGNSPVSPGDAIPTRPGVLAPAVVRRLDAAGADGRHAAALAAATAPAGRPSRSAAAELHRLLRARRGEIVAPLAGSIGGALLLLLLLTVLVAVAVKLRRRSGAR